MLKRIQRFKKTDRTCETLMCLCFVLFCLAGTNLHSVFKDTAHTPDSLKQQRSTLAMELLWIQQAISSRKKVRSLEFLTLICMYLCLSVCFIVCKIILFCFFCSILPSNREWMCHTDTGPVLKRTNILWNVFSLFLYYCVIYSTECLRIFVNYIYL